MCLCGFFWKKKIFGVLADKQYLPFSWPDFFFIFIFHFRKRCNYFDGFGIWVCLTCTCILLHITYIYRTLGQLSARHSARGGRGGPKAQSSKIILRASYNLIKQKQKQKKKKKKKKKEKKAF